MRMLGPYSHEGAGKPGSESLWASRHTDIPASRSTEAWARTAGGQAQEGNGHSGGDPGCTRDLIERRT